jgi:hypothetical protein
MVDTRQRARPRRRTRDFDQPESMAALRPSQHRAARNRAARRDRSAVEYWLRRLRRA